MRVLLGYSAGGTADTMLRLVGDKLSTATGQPFIVENKPGASGNIAARQAAAAQADGYTLLFGNTAEIAVNKYIMKNVGFDAAADLMAVAKIYDVPLILVVSSKKPYQNLGDLIAAARKPDSNITFASAGTGSPGHLAGEMLGKQSKVQMTHVPYKGAAPALIDVLAGRVDCYFSGITAVNQHLKAGTARALAVSSQKRSRFAPDLPTVSELINADFDFTLWGGLFAPTGTPANVIAILSEQVNRVLSLPEVRARIENEGSEATPGSPEQFSAFVKKQSSIYGQVVKDVNYVPE